MSTPSEEDRIQSIVQKCLLAQEEKNMYDRDYQIRARQHVADVIKSVLTVNARPAVPPRAMNEYESNNVQHFVHECRMYDTTDGIRELLIDLIASRQSPKA